MQERQPRQSFLKNEEAPEIVSHTPVDGSEIAAVYETTHDQYEEVVKASVEGI